MFVIKQFSLHFVCGLVMRVAYRLALELNNSSSAHGGITGGEYELRGGGELSTNSGGRPVYISLFQVLHCRVESDIVCDCVLNAPARVCMHAVGGRMSVAPGPSAVEVVSACRAVGC